MFWENITNTFSFLDSNPENSLPYSQMVNFINVQHAIQNPKQYLLINTFPTDSPYCVIQGTVSYPEEERIINEMMARTDIMDKHIIIYGKNSGDSTVIKKYKQMRSLELSSVYIYPGGMFEWLALQDIYGKTEFPVENWYSNDTRKTIHMDLLSYKPNKRNI
jgi:hypothetical protein